MKSSKIAIRLSAAASVFALLAGEVSAQSTSGAAGDAAGDAAGSIETVVVTGTHIQGVASTGSTVTTLTQDDILKTASPDAYYALQQMPQMLNLNSDSVNFGGARPGGAASNQGLGNFVNLRGVGQTLVLFNGQRIAGTGAGDTPLVDVVPSNILQRIDVQADGSSAIYGSDALTGTVNLIMQDPKDVFRVSAQDTFKRGYSSWYGNALLGHTWSSVGSSLGEGGIIVSYERNVTGSVSARALPWAFNDNLVPYEGAVGNYPITSSPGNVTGLGTTPAGNAAIYPIPANGIGSTGQLTLSQLGNPSNPNRSSLYERLNAIMPEIHSDALAVNMKQDIGSYVHAFAFGYADRRQGYADYGTSPQSATTISVPNTNPYSPCATASAAGSAGLPPPSQANSQGLTCPTNGTVSVPYSFVNETGPDFRLYNDKSYMVTLGADVDLPFQWTGRVSESMSDDVLLSQETGKINSTALKQVIGGSGKPSNIPFFNPFCSDQSGPCNSALTNNYISSYKGANDTNRLWDFNLSFQGPLFNLPAGPVRAALGYEYQSQYGLVSSTSNTTAAVGLVTPTTFAQSHFFSPEAYAEGYFPLISSDMNIPFVESLNFDAAIRYSAYTLPKVETYNPKFGMTYRPIDDVSIRGSFGTSFLAPTLGNSNPYSSSNVVNSTSSYNCGAFPGINAAACPSGAATPVNAFYVAGGNASLQPEKGKSWTLGVDWTPSFIPGLKTSVTYYKLVFTDRFTAPGSSTFPSGTYNAGYLDQFIVFNPTYFPNRAVVSNLAAELVPSLTKGAALTQAEYNQAYAAVFALPQYAAGVKPSLPVAFFSDGRESNSGMQKTDGFDFNASYDFDTDYGLAHLGITGTYVTSFLDQPVTGGAVYNRNNQFGFAQRLRGRLEAGLDKNGLSGTVYLNYANPYTADAQYIPAAALAQNPNYTQIASDITWDLSLGYDTADQFANYYGDNLRLQVVIKNVFDKKPPFFLNAGTSPSILYDSNFASPLGRTISLSLTKDFE